MSFSEKLRILESIVMLPTYGAVGYTLNKLIYATTLEGVRSLWYLDIKTNAKRKIADAISGVGEIFYGSPLIAFTRDVMRGKEKHRLYIYDLRREETFEVDEIYPMRIGGIAFDGEKFAVSGATEKSIEIWIIKANGGAEKIYETNNLLFVSDIKGEIIVGSGILKGNPKTMEIFVLNQKTGEFRVISPKEDSTNRNPRIHKDMILFTTSAYGNDRLMLYNIKKDSFETIMFKDGEYSYESYPSIINFDWLRNGSIWHIAVRDGRSHVFIDGKRLDVPEGYSTNLVEGEDKYFITWSSLKTPTSILSIEKSGKKKIILGEKLPPEIEEQFGEVKIIRYKSKDGLEVPAIVIENKAIGKPGPTIIYVHGGPWSSVNDSWSIMIASLVASGYHVVAPNYRGSTGYGEEFRRLIIGDPGGGELEDIIKSAEWAKNNGLASKIAIMGYSYGGYMTLLANGKYPDMWDAGVAGAAVADWEEMYELSDAMFRRFIEVLFAGKRELYRDRSPITYAQNVRAPLCIIQPQNDTRTPLKPIIKYIHKLMEHEKTFELHVIPDMGHAIVKMEDAMKVLYPAIIFLDTKIKKK